MTRYVTVVNFVCLFLCFLFVFFLFFFVFVCLSSLSVFCFLFVAMSVLTLSLFDFSLYNLCVINGSGKIYFNRLFWSWMNFDIANKITILIYVQNVII